MKFKKAPLIFNEYHDDLVTRTWLLHNLEKLGYECFCFEYDGKVSLDEYINITKNNIENIKVSADPKYVEEIIEERKRTELLKLLNAGTQPNLQTTNTKQLVEMAEKQFSKKQVQKCILQDAEYIKKEMAKIAKMLPEYELLLAILEKVKSLNMKYIGIDSNYADQRDVEHALKSNFSTKNSERDPVIAQRIAVTAKMYEGSIICLIGVGHLLGVTKHLVEKFATLPLLKPYQSNIENFKFIRIFDRNFEYDSSREEEIEKESIQLKNKFNWFNVETVLYQGPDTTILEDLTSNVSQPLLHL